ncbi:MAG TPA: MBL fold metallo-hydrolase [Polyangia bacterium]|nr:MBL fold metallo-hydrolase [Polyangia bacterium]
MNPVAETGAPLANPWREGLHHIGNSTHWIVLEGVRIVTDPWLGEPADGLLHHSTPPSPLPREPDVVLVTHAHEDHFDPLALRRLSPLAAVLVPTAAMARAVRALGFGEVHVVTPGQRLGSLRGLTIDVVRGRHTVREVCYRVARKGRAFFFAGDSKLTPEIEAVARAGDTPFVVLPGERSRLFGRRVGMSPEEAIALAGRFGARRAVLSHHEHRATAPAPWRWIVRVPPVDPAEFPPWFTVPKPGEHVAFPWEAPS